MQKGNALIFLLVGIVIIAAIGGAFYLGRSTLLRQDSAGQATPKLSPTPAVTSQTPPPTSTTNPVPNGTGETANWKTYTSTNGKYSIKYPEIYKLSENITSSVDGVKVNSPNTIELNAINTSDPVIRINFSKIEGTSTLSELVDKNSWCVEITSNKAKFYTLDNRQAFIFENTPCGAWGSTDIYTINNNMFYRIDVPGGATGTKQKLDQIISTFKFTN